LVIIIIFSGYVAANIQNFVACILERVCALPGSIGLNIGKILSQTLLYIGMN